MLMNLLSGSGSLSVRELGPDVFSNISEEPAINGENGNFVTSAKKILNDYQKPYFTDVEYSMTSSVDERKAAGYQYAHDNFLKLTEDMNAEDEFEFVTHRMGGLHLERG